VTTEISELLVASKVVETAATAERTATIASLGVEPTADSSDAAVLRTVRAAIVLEEEAQAATGRARREAYSAAFACWVDVLNASARQPETLEALPNDDDYDPRLWLALRLAATGVASERITEARHALTSALPTAAELSSRPSAGTWFERVRHDVTIAVALLIRKANGWDDIDLALAVLARLRAEQNQFEPAYLAGSDDDETAALRLISLYHQAQLVTTAGRYIESGEGASEGVRARLATHLRQAEEAASIVGDGELAREARLVHVALAPSVERSIWAQVELLGENARDLALSLTTRDRAHPTLELWPGQIAAMNEGMFDSNRRALVVQMPTSGGKTLLAKFSIMQAFSLNPNSSIAYVVPTKVLANQVTDELRRDFAPLHKRVEQAVPVFDLNPTEDLLLRQRPDVIVTTWEKLDLLVRSGHESVANLSLLIVDEAHNIADPSRGARLELLLATVKRDKPNVRYLLLSPFMPNADDLVAWLGSSRQRAAIHVDWQPNKKVVGAIELELRKHPDGGQKKQRNVVFRTVESVDNAGLPAGFTIDLGVSAQENRAAGPVNEVAQRRLLERGQTLIVCGGKATAMTRAAEIAAGRPERDLTAFAATVVRHVESELGPGNDLGYAIRRGVAYHHAGVSSETRRLIEALMSEKFLDVITGTTTLAQGANFPLANVLIESYQMGQRKLTHSDFWNIAGRAGRGMLSGTGLVGFTSVTQQQRSWWGDFFTNEAADVASQLSEIITKADAIGSDIRLPTLNSVEHLSEFLQYLAHAYRVSGALRSANDVEDLLRSSLVYTTAERTSPNDAEQLVAVCRRYLESIRRDGPLVSLADGTGFSTPTVKYLMAKTYETPGVRSSASWDPAVLFGADSSGLAARVEMIADLPEMTLGEDKPGPFNAERVANILRDWVNGLNIAELVDRHGDKSKAPGKRTAEFVAYLQGRLTASASWGMGALEKVALTTNAADTSRREAGHVPSMIFYGVNEREAVWLRMAGLGRVTATRAARLWREQGRTEPTSFDEVRRWVSNVPTRDWDRVLVGTPLTGDDVVSIWDRTSV